MRSGARSVITRRQALLRLGSMAGSAAVYAGATALGLFGGQDGWAADSMQGRFAMRKRPSGAAPVTVAILGGGIGGLCAALELTRAGYKVIVLEASKRIGGRNLTARTGTVIDELGNPQTCKFDDHPDLYFNCGPARIPGTHERLLDYCRQFGIRLENFVNDNPNAYIYSDGFNGGQPMRQREYIADAKGILAEFAAKAVGNDQLDRPIDAGDEEKLIGFLARYGDLNRELEYQGTDRAGFATGGLLQPGVKKETVTNLSDLLKSPYWQYPMHFSEGETQFPSMLTPTGGMDKVVDGFTREIGHHVVTQAIVHRITVTENGVAIDYARNGVAEQVNADFCLNSIPGHLMNGVEHNLPADFSGLLSEMRGSKLSKVGLQMKTRFWEQENIYGGITWIDHPLTQMWYPSHATHSEKGVLLAGYCFGPQANDAVTSMRHEGRVAAALDIGEKVHGPAFRENFEAGVSLSWQNYNYMCGCGSGFQRNFGESDRSETHAKKRTLQEPVGGRYFMIGDQVSFHPGWQEGALAITHQALSRLEDRLAKESV